MIIDVVKREIEAYKRGEEEEVREIVEEVKEEYISGKEAMYYKGLGRDEAMLYIDSIRMGLDIGALCGDFDSFCLAMEYNRKARDSFYLPRRRIFKKLGIIDDLQLLADGKIDVLGISMPQRTGKSRIGLFFITFMILRNADKERQTFGTGHSSGLMKSFYDEINMYLTDNQTYRALEIFDRHKIARVSAEYLYIDLDKPKGMPNLVFRSIDGSITGAVEGGLLMYADDLIKEPNEVINTEIADKIWANFNTLVLGRMKQKVPLLYLGTRWGINCPITRLEEAFKPDKLEKIGLKLRCVFKSYSCYDENGESNFDYDYGVGFDTAYYRRLELTMKKSDPALWSAMYLGKPITRYSRPFENLTFYSELPESECDYVSCVVDVATQVNGDNWACPIGKFYTEDREIYIVDVIYNNKGAGHNIPITANKIIQYGATQCEFEEKESVNQGSMKIGIGYKVKDILEDNNYKCNIHSHNACGLKAKRDRILMYTDDILGIETEKGWTIHFNEERYLHNIEYKNFVDDITNWSELDKVQKTQTDDSIDSIAQLLRYCTINRKSKVRTSYSLKSLGL